MSDQEKSERLAALEAKFDIFLDLLKEIREDLKDHISKDELEELKARVKTLEENEQKTLVKLSAASATLTIVVSILVKYLA